MYKNQLENNFVVGEDSEIIKRKRAEHESYEKLSKDLNEKFKKVFTTKALEKISGLTNTKLESIVGYTRSQVNLLSSIDKKLADLIRLQRSNKDQRNYEKEIKKAVKERTVRQMRSSKMNSSYYTDERRQDIISQAPGFSDLNDNLAEFTKTLKKMQESQDLQNDFMKQYFISAPGMMERFYGFLNKTFLDNPKLKGLWNLTKLGAGWISDIADEVLEPLPGMISVLLESFWPNRILSFTKRGRWSREVNVSNAMPFESMISLLSGIHKNVWLLNNKTLLEMEAKFTKKDKKEIEVYERIGFLGKLADTLEKVKGTKSVLGGGALGYALSALGFGFTGGMAGIPMAAAGLLGVKGLASHAYDKISRRREEQKYIDDEADKKQKTKDYFGLNPAAKKAFDEQLIKVETDSMKRFMKNDGLSRMIKGFFDKGALMKQDREEKEAEEKKIVENFQGAVAKRLNERGSVWADGLGEFFTDIAYEIPEFLGEIADFTYDSKNILQDIKKDFKNGKNTLLGNISEIADFTYDSKNILQDIKKELTSYASSLSNLLVPRVVIDTKKISQELKTAFDPFADDLKTSIAKAITDSLNNNQSNIYQMSNILATALDPIATNLKAASVGFLEDYVNNINNNLMKLTDAGIDGEGIRVKIMGNFNNLTGSGEVKKDIPKLPDKIEDNEELKQAKILVNGFKRKLQEQEDRMNYILNNPGQVQFDKHMTEREIERLKIRLADAEKKLNEVNEKQPFTMKDKPFDLQLFADVNKDPESVFIHFTAKGKKSNLIDKYYKNELLKNVDKYILGNKKEVKSNIFDMKDLDRRRLLNNSSETPYISKKGIMAERAKSDLKKLLPDLLGNSEKSQDDPMEVYLKDQEKLRDLFKVGSDKIVEQLKVGSDKIVEQLKPVSEIYTPKNARERRRMRLAQSGQVTVDNPKDFIPPRDWLGEIMGLFGGGGMGLKVLLGGALAYGLNHYLKNIPMDVIGNIIKNIFDRNKTWGDVIKDAAKEAVNEVVNRFVKNPDMRPNDQKTTPGEIADKGLMWMLGKAGDKALSWAASPFKWAAEKGANAASWLWNSKLVQKFPGVSRLTNMFNTVSEFSPLQYFKNSRLGKATGEVWDFTKTVGKTALNNAKENSKLGRFMTWLGNTKAGSWFGNQLGTYGTKIMEKAGSAAASPLGKIFGSGFKTVGKMLPGFNMLFAGLETASHGSRSIENIKKLKEGKGDLNEVVLDGARSASMALGGLIGGVLGMAAGPAGVAAGAASGIQLGGMAADATNYLIKSPVEKVAKWWDGDLEKKNNEFLESNVVTMTETKMMTILFGITPRDLYGFPKGKLAELRALYRQIMRVPEKDRPAELSKVITQVRNFVANNKRGATKKFKITDAIGRVTQFTQDVHKTYVNFFGDYRSPETTVVDNIKEKGNETVNNIMGGTLSFSSIFGLDKSTPNAIKPTPISSPSPATKPNLTVKNIGKVYDNEGQFKEGDQDKFLLTMLPHALKISKETGIPYTAILAQAVHESGWGKKTAGSFNYFGVKAHGKQWSGKTKMVNTWEEVNGKKVRIVDSFRAYDDMESGIRGWLDFLRQQRKGKRYEKVLNAKDDQTFFRELQNSGYATDSMYASKGIELSRSVQNRLNKLKQKGLITESGDPAPIQTVKEKITDTIKTVENGVTVLYSEGKKKIEENLTKENLDKTKTSIVSNIENLSNKAKESYNQFPGLDRSLKALGYTDDQIAEFKAKAELYKNTAVSSYDTTKDVLTKKLQDYQATYYNQTKSVDPNSFGPGVENLLGKSYMSYDPNSYTPGISSYFKDKKEQAQKIVREQYENLSNIASAGVASLQLDQGIRVEEIGTKIFEVVSKIGKVVEDYEKEKKLKSEKGGVVNVQGGDTKISVVSTHGGNTLSSTIMNGGQGGMPGASFDPSSSLK